MTSNLVIVSGEDISGTSYSIENSGDIFEIDNEGTLSSLENSGTIGNAENESSSYGIENAGTINEITNEAKGTIEGSVDSINNETGAQIGMSGTTGISNAGHIQTIENQGTIGVSGSVGIENTGEITTVNNIIGGEIEGEIENEVSSTNAATGSTGINLISNAGTISADLTNGGNIVSLENKANGNIQGTILNTGTISGIENYSIINTLTNEGTLGSATQGIDNGANATINDLTNEGGGLITLITNESSGTIDNLTNTESNSSGTTKVSTIDEINNGGSLGTLMNQAVIGGGSVNIAINNTGTIGNIEDGDTATSTTLSGTIEGVQEGISNSGSGTINTLGIQSKIEGTGNAGIGIYNDYVIGKIILSSNEKVTGTRASLYNDSQGYVGEVDNYSTLAKVVDDGFIGEKKIAIGGVTKIIESQYGIINEQGGTINEIINEAKGTIEGSKEGIENEGTVGISTTPSDGTNTGAIENAGTISSINNTGTIGGTGDSYGIDNQGGTIGQIENGSSSSSDSESTTQNSIIQGTTYGIENEAGGQIGNEAGEDGIDNYGTITGIEDAGTIGTSATADAIYNNLGGTINTITVEDGGTITGKGGIENEGTIGVAASPSDETGTGAIENAGTINSIDNASGGVIGGTGDTYGIDNQEKGTIGGVSNAGTIGVGTTPSDGTVTVAIENAGLITYIGSTGTIGGTGDSYGIDNTGKIEQITNGLSSSSLSKATIQGLTYGIYNEAGGQIGNESVGGIDNYGTISEIDDAGVIESSIGSAINNVKGVINTIKVEQDGSITSDTVGINNYGTIGEIDDAGTIKTSSTTGAVTIPIANASGSTINTIIVEKGGVVTGTDGIANSGMIGTSATTNGDTTATETYGIENSGTISGIENGEWLWRRDMESTGTSKD